MQSFKMTIIIVSMISSLFIGGKSKISNIGITDYKDSVRKKSQMFKMSDLKHIEIKGLQTHSESKFTYEAQDSILFDKNSYTFTLYGSAKIKIFDAENRLINTLEGDEIKFQIKNPSK